MTDDSEPAFRALAIGFYGAPNVGDEALLDVLLRRVTELGGELVIASIDPAGSARMHGVEAVEFSNLGEVCRALIHCDVMIMGGGGIFQDHHPFNLDALYLPYANDISGYARPMLMARQLGVPVIIWGHGVGPLTAAGPRALVRELFEGAAAVSVRDQKSLALLREIGVGREISVGADPGWLFSRYHAVPKRPTSGRAGKTLAVVVREWGKGSWKKQITDALQKVLTPEWRIQWIAFQANTDRSGALSDLPLVDELRGKLGLRPDDEVLTPATPVEAWTLLAEADAVFSMRLHASVLALLAGKPICGLEYDEKLTHAHRMAEMPDVLRLKIDDPVGRYETALRALMQQEWKPEPGVLESLQRSAQVHLDILESCKGLQVRDVTFEAGSVDWLGMWLQQALREVSEVGLRSQHAHELLRYRDHQLAEQSKDVATASGEVARLNGETAGLNNEITRLNSEADGLNSEIDRLKRESARLVLEVEQGMKQIVEMREHAEVSRNALIERNKEMTEQLSSRLDSVERNLRETEILLANVRDELDHSRVYIQDKEIYIALLRQEVERLETRLAQSQLEVIEARDIWRRVRKGAAIVRRDLLRGLAAPFKLAGVWRQYGFKVAFQQIPRRMKTIGVASLQAPEVPALEVPCNVRSLRHERLLVLVDHLSDAHGWPTRGMQLAKAGERAGFRVRVAVLGGGEQLAAPPSVMQRLVVGASDWLNEVRAEHTRVLLADASPRAIELAVSASERGAEVVVDFGSLGNGLVDKPEWARIRGIASRGIHTGTAPAIDGLPLQMIEEAGDNEIFDSYKTYAAPPSFSRNRDNVLVVDISGRGRAQIDALLLARHDVAIHVAGPGALELPADVRVKRVEWSWSPEEIAPLIAHASSIVVLGGDGSEQEHGQWTQLVYAALLLERPTLVELNLSSLSSCNLHVLESGRLPEQLALQGSEDFGFVSRSTWLGHVEFMMKPTYPASVSAVVLIHNNRRIIERCVRTMLEHCGDWLHEIVVVDNQSSDGGPELVEELFGGHAKVKLVRNHENGCSSGRNLGVKHSSGKYIAFFDSDQWLTAPTCFPESVAILNMDEGVGAIGWNAGWFDATRDDLGGPISDYLPHRGMNAESLIKGYRDDIGFLGTSCMFMTRELFERIDGFDTFYDPTCFEDTDICFQVKKAGYSVAFRDLAGVRHQPHQTTGASEGSERYKRLFDRNAAYFREKWQGFPEFFVDLKSWH